VSSPEHGSGAGPAPEAVVPPAHPAEPERGTGGRAIPLGTPAGAEEWRDLKRRAGEPDEPADYPEAVVDPETPSR